MKRITIVMVGNLLYHFDRALFGLLVPFLAPLFFPQFDPVYALISMYLIIPLTIFAKPLGALLFGHLGDRYGTQRVLSLTLIGMALKTGLMGCLPTYAQIGAWAPIFLAFTRMMIGFFSSGETTGGAIMTFEKCKPEKRNLMSAIFDASGILGVLLASCSIWALHSYPNFWRYLFWFGSLIGTVGWLLRRANRDEQKVERVVSPPLRTLWTYRRTVLSVALLAGFSYSNWYLISSFMNGFLPLISPITKGEAMSLNSLMLLLDFFLLPVFGLISLKFRREKLILLSILGVILLAGPSFLFLKEATLFKAGLVRIILMIFGVALAAPYHAWVYENTPENHRYLVGAFSTAVGGRLFGSPILPLGLWLYHKTGWIAAPTIPLMCVGVGALIFFVIEARKDLKILT